MRMATDCIACGCCVSSCTMVHHHADYAGPAALTRAYSLLADNRDGLFAQRLDAALTSCHECRTEANCTEVCPKGISPTRRDQVHPAHGADASWRSDQPGSDACERPLGGDRLAAAGDGSRDVPAARGRVRCSARAWRSRSEASRRSRRSGRRRKRAKDELDSAGETQRSAGRAGHDRADEIRR